MIIYFADRAMNILGSASTGLPKGLMITNDKKTEEISEGVAIFECIWVTISQIRIRTKNRKSM